jgi:uncharacterized protein YbjT (DUF2867 family)
VITRDVFVTGGTGYVGQRLVPALVRRRHRVRVLTRAASASRIPHGATAVIGDALNPESYLNAVVPGDTLVHLVGTPRPSPAKAAEFARVDLPSIEAAVTVAARAGVAHLVYVSVAHPAPVMHAYIAVRAQGEALIGQAGLTATLVRPWYVLGPGHWWPLILLPMYAAAVCVPSFRDGAHRLGLVTIRQMVAAMVSAVENPPPLRTQRVVDVPHIRRGLAAVMVV